MNKTTEKWYQLLFEYAVDKKRRKLKKWTEYCSKYNVQRAKQSVVMSAFELGKYPTEDDAERVRLAINSYHTENWRVKEVEDKECYDELFAELQKDLQDLAEKYKAKGIALNISAAFGNAIQGELFE